MQMNAKPKPGKIDIGGQILGCNTCHELLKDILDDQVQEVVKETVATLWERRAILNFYPV